MFAEYVYLPTSLTLESDYFTYGGNGDSTAERG